jgi:HEAT repeat protein
METVRPEPDRDLQSEAIADSPDRMSAIRFLLGVARGDGHREVREEALDALGDMDDERAVDALAQSYDSARDEEARNEIIDALGEAESTQALQKLMVIAQRDPSVRLRRRAIALLGESNDPAALKFG